MSLVLLGPGEQAYMHGSNLGCGVNMKQFQVNVVLWFWLVALYSYSFTEDHRRKS